MNTTTRALAVTVAAAAAALPALPAMANDADVVRRGACSGSSAWKLKASPENGRIEVEGEVDSRTGQSWNWLIRHNGDVAARGSAVTQAPSGSFEVRRLLVNLRGTDGLVFRAENPRSGEVCRGTLSF